MLCARMHQHRPSGAWRGCKVAGAGTFFNRQKTHEVAHKRTQVLRKGHTPISSKQNLPKQDQPPGQPPTYREHRSQHCSGPKLSPKRGPTARPSTHLQRASVAELHDDLCLVRHPAGRHEGRLVVGGRDNVPACVRARVETNAADHMRGESERACVPVHSLMSHESCVRRRAEERQLP